MENPGPGPAPALAGGPSPQSTDAAQEAALRSKYGGLLPKKKMGLPVDHRFFDSADWALSKQAAAAEAAAASQQQPLGPVQPRPPAALPPGLPSGPGPTLLAPPKLEPSVPRPRGPSHLGNGGGR